MTKKEFWIIGGEFSSLNFHTLDPATTIVAGPYVSRETAQREWQTFSEAYRSKASYRFIITETQLTVPVNLL